MALSAKQQLFVDEYLQCLNATQAALRAGYSKKTAHAIGWENLRKPEISEAIDQRLQESAMSANEVIARLTEHASGDMGDFWSIQDNGDPVLDLTGGKLRLIKKMKVKTTSRTISDIDYVTTEVDFELYDAQAALVHLGKYHKLFADRTEISGPDGGPIETKQDLSTLTIDELLQLKSLVSKANANPVT